MTSNKYTITFIIILFLSSFLFSENAINLYDTGKLSYFDEKYDEAIFYFKKALELNPNYVEVLLSLAHLYYDIENYDYAFNYINKALYQSNNNSELLTFSADVDTKNGLYDIAEKKYKNVLSKNPLDVQAHNGLANLYIKTNKLLLAKNILENVLKTEPYNFDALNMIASYYETFDLSKANEYYLLNIEKNSLNSNSFFYYSIFNFKNNKINKALDNIQIALKIKDRMIYKKYYGKYLLFLNEGDKALKTFQEIIGNENNNYLIFYYLSLAYCIISDNNKAIESLKKTMHLRDDDEISSCFFNQILINKYDIDDKLRIGRATYFLNQAIKAKKENKTDLYVFLLKEAIRLYPKNAEARIELADYFLSLNLPERYLRELNVASKYSKDTSLHDKLEIEQKRISYRLGDDWNINQYSIDQDIFYIPTFMTIDINNIHYNSEKIVLQILKNISFEQMKYNMQIFDEKEYSIPEKMKICRDKDYPFYMDLQLKENGNSVEIKLKLFNSKNNELIKEYKSNNYGNNKIITSSYQILISLNNDLPYKAHIIKIMNDRAIINTGRRSGVKLKDKFWILKNSTYPIELNRANIIFKQEDIKGNAVAVKVDENISEIKFTEDEYFKSVDIDDIIIYQN